MKSQADGASNSRTRSARDKAEGFKAFSSMYKQKSGNAVPEGNEVPARDAQARACALDKAGVDCDASDWLDWHSAMECTRITRIVSRGGRNCSSGSTTSPPAIATNVGEIAVACVRIRPAGVRCVAWTRRCGPEG